MELATAIAMTLDSFVNECLSVNVCLSTAAVSITSCTLLSGEDYGCYRELEQYSLMGIT